MGQIILNGNHAICLSAHVSERRDFIVVNTYNNIAFHREMIAKMHGPGDRE